VHPDTGISSKAMSIMNSFINVSPSSAGYFHGFVVVPTNILLILRAFSSSLFTYLFVILIFFKNCCRISLTRLPSRPRTWPATTRSPPLLLVKSRPLSASSSPVSSPSTLSLKAPRLSPSSPLVKHTLTTTIHSFYDY
jgi:hypothetical protein